MSALLDSIGVDRVSTIGPSGGGITALHMATRQLDRVTRLVVISAPASFPPQARAIQRNFTEALLGDDEMARLRERHSREGQVEAAGSQQSPNLQSNHQSATRNPISNPQSNHQSPIINRQFNRQSAVCNRRSTASS